MSLLKSISLRIKILLILFVFMIPLAVLIQFYIIPIFSFKIEESKKDQTRTAVEIVMTLIKDVDAKVKLGKWTLQEAQDFVKLSLKTLRYNKDEYFWVNDLNARMVSHGVKSELDGKDVSMIKDPQGVQIFTEFVNIVKTSRTHSGFLNYSWPRGKAEKPLPKISFVELYEPWGWVVGNGVYIDDIVEEVNVFKVKIWTSLGVFFILLAGFVWMFGNGLAVDFGKIVEEVRSSAEKLSSLSGMLTNSSTHLSARVQEESSALTETASSLEQISAMISRNNENSQELEKIQQESLGCVDSGKKSVEGVLQVISSLKQANELMEKNIAKSNQEVERISEVITEIANKTKVINEIVFQTRLLSFNASVEAARAGDMGKGFSVVAEEVGRLAEMSGKSAVEISEILSKSSEMVNQIISKNSSSLKKVLLENTAFIDEGVVAAKQCEESFSKISSVSQVITNKVAQITSASQEQALGVQQINQAMAVIDSLSQKNLAVVHELSGSSEGLMSENKVLSLSTHKIRSLVHGAS